MNTATSITLTRLQQTGLLLLCMSVSGCIAVYLGKDLSWDVANYHVYNAYALLNHRQQLDYWPTSFIHVFLSPTIDLFTYWAITHLSPLTTEFLFGAFHGLNIWLTFLIAQACIKCPQKWQTLTLCLFLSILGYASSVVLPGTGALENDNTLSVPLLAAVLLQIRYWQHPKDALLITSGILFGISVGGKLTNLLYLIGACLSIAFLPLPLKNRLSTLLILGASALFGITLISGYWMLHLWQQYQNPVFPFFNNIFHSPYFSENEFSHTWLFPESKLELLLYPLFFSINGTPPDGPFRDLRFAVLFLLVIAYALMQTYQAINNWINKESKPKIKNTRKNFWSAFGWGADTLLANKAQEAGGRRAIANKVSAPQPNADQKFLLHYHWLLNFIILSYLFWLQYFAIVRYFIVGAILAPLMIYLLTKQLIKNKKTRTIFLIITYTLLTLTLKPISTIRWPNYTGTYFNIALPTNLNSSALVIMAYSAYAITNQPKPQTYLIPYLPKTWQVIGIPFITPTQVHFELNEQAKVTQLIAGYPSNTQIYLLASDYSIHSLIQQARHYRLTPSGACHLIKSDRQYVSNSDTFLCPVSRRPI